MRPLLLLLAAPLPLLLGCDGKDAGAVRFGGDTAIDTGAAGTGGTGGTGGSGQVFPDDDPSFTVLIDGSAWSVDPSDDGNLGYFTTSAFFASAGEGSSAQTVSIQVDGDLQVPGTYAVTYASYTQQVAQDTPTVYEVDDPEGFTITVLGYAETGYDERKYIYAESGGSAILSDGSELSEVQVTSYPYIF